VVRSFVCKLNLNILVMVVWKWHQIFAVE